MLDARLLYLAELRQLMMAAKTPEDYRKFAKRADEVCDIIENQLKNVE